MKSWPLGIVAFLVLFILFSNAANAEDFTGSWSVSGTLGDPIVMTTSPVCVFKQDGDEIKGSCKGPNSAGPANGMVDGNKITFDWDLTATTSIGATGTAFYRGVLGSDGVIRGTWTFAGIHASGAFTAQRVK